MQAIRQRMTYANVTATLALVLALGGGAVYAADKIGSQDIARNAIKSRHVKNDRLTGRDVKEATLAEVPNAAHARSADAAGAAATAGSADLLDGLDSSAFAGADAARSVGPILIADADDGVPTTADLFSLGAFTISYNCADNGAQRSAAIRLNTSEPGGHFATISNVPGDDIAVTAENVVTPGGTAFLASAGLTSSPDLQETVVTLLPPGGTIARTAIVYAGTNLLGTDCVFGYTLFAP